MGRGVICKGDKPAQEVAATMGIIGHGYGSEFHLLRYLGRHRHDLNQAVEEQTGGRVLDWLDCGFDQARRFPHLDTEWRGVDFVDQDTDVRSDWSKFWPQTGNVPNWDAVGLLQSSSYVEFLLVEAKAHSAEIQSECTAVEAGGLAMIRQALGETIAANGFASNAENWLRPYYQHANRLAQLHFLRQHNVPARLLFIYFLGDGFPEEKKKVCPKSKEEWGLCLQPVYSHLGLTGKSDLEKRVHNLFLQV